MKDKQHSTLLKNIPHEVYEDIMRRWVADKGNRTAKEMQEYYLEDIILGQKTRNNGNRNT